MILEACKKDKRGSDNSNPPHTALDNKKREGWRAGIRSGNGKARQAEAKLRGLIFFFFTYNEELEKKGIRNPTLFSLLAPRCVL